MCGFLYENFIYVDFYERILYMRIYICGWKLFCLNLKVDLSEVGKVLEESTKQLFYPQLWWGYKLNTFRWIENSKCRHFLCPPLHWDLPEGRPSDNNTRGPSSRGDDCDYFVFDDDDDDDNGKHEPIGNNVNVWPARSRGSDNSDRKITFGRRMILMINDQWLLCVCYAGPIHCQKRRGGGLHMSRYV